MREVKNGNTILYWETKNKNENLEPNVYILLKFFVIGVNTLEFNPVPSGYDPVARSYE